MKTPKKHKKRKRLPKKEQGIPIPVQDEDTLRAIFRDEDMARSYMRYLL